MALDSLAAVASLVLAPLGMAPDSLPGALKAGVPHYHFDSDGPVLRLVRAEKTGIQSDHCGAWSDALVTLPSVGASPQWQPQGLAAEAAIQTLKNAWEPWEPKDLEPIESCDDFPCKVKFDEKESLSLKELPKKSRLARFYELVLARATHYLQTGLRPAYETPGKPVDLWKVMEDEGFRSTMTKPIKPNLVVRKLNFDPERMLTLHMILDRRTAQQRVGDLWEAASWVRDAYVDHYFDGWSEGSLLVCDPKSGEVLVVQLLLTEMDLLKNRGFFAHALFPKYRSAFEENGKIYLDKEFQRIESVATQEHTLK